ncbi:MAG: methionine--tRNA ligase [Patescibacteria group bacterium]|nr:methionine--tRNA ligase [Patescibacteria group bacterium]MDE2218112.1 methionine--tRNA ligase [Patescibacteria group bacterium]
MNKRGEINSNINSVNFYITTTLAYVNADPHIGFAMEITRADIIARYKKLLGFDVFFNTGTDEHGLKIYRKALESGQDPHKYASDMAEKFKDLIKILNLSEDVNFIRTTDERHKKSAQEFWKICDKNGFIYKKNYKIKYCVGCELEKTESELEEGRCPLHPNQNIEIIDEENYFFAFSEFQKSLLELYENNPDFIIPSSRFKEIKAFVGRGLEDFSVSRLKSKMPWGIPVPNDSEHVMYVWFDALVNYVSAVGWPEDADKFNKWWPVTQYCGKDNLRQQAAMWQAMLLAAGLSPSRQIIVNGFITSGGQKMSKSLGNVINPASVVSEYGADALRYYFARELNPFEDGDFTMEKFKAAYNGNLANGLGNLTSRIIKMSETYLKKSADADDAFEFPKEFSEYLEKFELNKAVDFIWRKIGEMDSYIQKNQPFKVVKKNRKEGEKMIVHLVGGLSDVANLLSIFMPNASENIKKAIKENKMLEKNLFPRKE